MPVAFLTHQLGGGGSPTLLNSHVAWLAYRPLSLYALPVTQPFFQTSDSPALRLSAALPHSLLFLAGKSHWTTSSSEGKVVLPSPGSPFLLAQPRLPALIPMPSAGKLLPQVQTQGSAPLSVAEPTAEF